MKRIELNNGKIFSILLLVLGHVLLQNRVVEASVYVDSDYFRHHRQITTELVEFINSSVTEDVSKWVDKLLQYDTASQPAASVEIPINHFLTFYYSQDIIQRMKSNSVICNEITPAVNIIQRNNIPHLSNGEDPLG